MVSNSGVNAQALSLNRVIHFHTLYKNFKLANKKHLVSNFMLNTLFGYLLG